MLSTTKEPKQSQLFQPDPKHLATLQEFATTTYNLSVECNIQGKETKGAIRSFEINGLQEALDLYVALIGEGYSPVEGIQYAPSCLMGPVTDHILLHLKKPQALIEAEVAEVIAEVEANYLTGLETERQAEITRQVQFQVEAAKRKAEVERLAKEIEVEAAIRAEVEAALGVR